MPILACFLEKGSGAKILVEKTIFTCHIVFALISTVFICLGCNFTFSKTMHMEFFRILLTKPENAVKKYIFCYEGNQKFISRKTKLHFNAKGIFSKQVGLVKITHILPPKFWTQNTLK